MYYILYMTKTFKGNYEHNKNTSITNNEYHSHDSVSKSTLDRINIAPERVIKSQHNYLDAFRLGTAFHSYILEPDKDDVIVAPAGKRNTKEGKQEWLEFLTTYTDPKLFENMPVNEWPEQFEKETGKVYVSIDEIKMLDYMQASIKNNTLASALLNMEGEAETSFFWTDKQTELTCKIRPDFISGDKEVIIDLKSIQRADKNSFKKSCRAFRYDVQAAFYSHGIKEIYGVTPEFYFIAVEKEFPNGCAVYKLDTKNILKAYDKFRENLNALGTCVANNYWPSYSNDLELSIYYD